MTRNQSPKSSAACRRNLSIKGTKKPEQVLELGFRSGFAPVFLASNELKNPEKARRKDTRRHASTRIIGTATRHDTPGRR
jgi:hypothetical protein